MPRGPNPIDESTYQGRLSAAIRARREKLGLTVADAAGAGGMAAASWYDLETGRRSALKNLPAVAKALRCSGASLVAKAERA